MQETLPIGWNEVEDQPRGVTRRGIHHIGFVDPYRFRHVKHDTRTALHHQAEAEGLDQAAPGLAGLGASLKVTWGISTTTR